MSDEWMRYQGLANQQGQTRQNAEPYEHPRKRDLAIEIPSRVAVILSDERDRKVRKLRAEADRIEKMTTIEYVANGLWTHDIHSFELLGRMAKVRWEGVEYRDDKPGWRAHDSFRQERYVDKSEVAEMLSDSGSDTK